MSAPTSGLDIVRIGGLSSSSSSSSSACVQQQREGSSSSSSSNESSSSSARMQFESSTGSTMQFESSRGQLLPREEDGIISDYDGTRSTPRHHQQQQQTTGPTANVGELMSKAKKAAASLWMILHAQNCRLPDDKCPHRGCHETKLLLAHVKPCPAGPDFPCPSRRRGCNETRKLLAHYRRCKDIRTRQQQVGLLGGRRSLLLQQQQRPDQGSSCLVCSLVARHARGAMIDRTSVGVCGDSRGRNGVVPASLPSSSLGGKFRVEGGLSDRTRVTATTAFERTPSMILMPPPPPRYGSCPSSSSSASASCSSNESFSLRAPAEVDLGTSVDSSAGASLPISRRPGKRMEPTEDDLIVPGRDVPAAAISTTTSPRQRARSYDERQTRVKFAPVVIAECEPRRFDERGDEGGGGGRVMRPRSNIGNNARPRSSSCSNSDVGDAAISTTSRGFEAIVEEGVVDCEDPIFSMDL